MSRATESAIREAVRKELDGTKSIFDDAGIAAKITGVEETKNRVCVALEMAHERQTRIMTRRKERQVRGSGSYSTTEHDEE